MRKADGFTVLLSGFTGSQYKRVCHRLSEQTSAPRQVPPPPAQTAFVILLFILCRFRGHKELTQVFNAPLLVYSAAFLWRFFSDRCCRLRLISISELVLSLVLDGEEADPATDTFVSLTAASVLHASRNPLGSGVKGCI